LAESVQGTELDKMFVKEEFSQVQSAAEPPIQEYSVVDTNAEDYLQQQMSTEVVARPPVVLSKRKQRNKCDICFKVFKLYGRLAHHR
jgi:hypothetical protein